MHRWPSANKSKRSQKRQLLRFSRTMYHLKMRTGAGLIFCSCFFSVPFSIISIRRFFSRWVFYFAERKFTKTSCLVTFEPANGIQSMRRRRTRKKRNDETRGNSGYSIIKEEKWNGGKTIKFEVGWTVVLVVVVFVAVNGYLSLFVCRIGGISPKVPQ